MAIQQKLERFVGQFIKQKTKPKAINSSKLGNINCSNYGIYKSNGIIKHGKGAD